MNLGGIAKDNLYNLDFMECKLFEGTGAGVSHLWKSIDLTNLYEISISPKSDITLNSSSYIFSCDGIIIPYSYNPDYLTMYLGLQGANTIIRYGTEIEIDGLFADAQMFTVETGQMIAKKHNSPGASLDFSFNLTSPVLLFISKEYYLILVYYQHICNENYISFPFALLTEAHK